MITADKLALITNLPTHMLSAVLDSSGYKDCKFKTAKFLGITNGGQFCYSVTYIENDAEEVGKVFVTYNQSKDQITADF